MESSEESSRPIRKSHSSAPAVPMHPSAERTTSGMSERSPLPSSSAQLSLFSDGEPVATSVAPVAPVDPDADAREFATDPRRNVVLEASAGTGKTSVLVWRYINLLKAGVDPAHILAMTFTRKAAAEMRERIIRELREAAVR